MMEINLNLYKYNFMSLVRNDDGGDAWGNDSPSLNLYYVNDYADNLYKLFVYVKYFLVRR
jgi:hypothetical protein